MACAKYGPVFGRADDPRIFESETSDDGRLLCYRDGSGIIMPLPAQLRAYLTEGTVLAIVRRTNYEEEQAMMLRLQIETIAWTKLSDRMGHPFLGYELSTGQVLGLPEFQVAATERTNVGLSLIHI